MKRSLLVAPVFFSGLVLFCVFAQSSSAHSLFIQSGRYLVKKGDDSPLFFSYGHIVPFGDGVRGEKLADISVSPPDGRRIAVPIRGEKGLQSHMVEYDRVGTWMLTARTAPGYYTVYVDKEGREHHVIKPISAVKEKAAEIVTSYYSKQYAKTCVVCDTPSDGPLPVAGMELELVPAANLFTVRPGERVEFQVYRDGKPFTGEGTWDATYAGFSTLSEDMFYPKTTVKNGRFAVMIAHPGRWFIRYVVKLDAPESKREEFHQLKLSASFVLQVDNRRRREKKKKHLQGLNGARDGSVTRSFGIR